MGDITGKDLAKLLKLVGADGDSPTKEGPWKIGQKYLVRTVTMMITGKLVAIHPQELELVEACWIANSGRFHKALRGEWDTNAEHEPFPSTVIVGRGSIVDAAPLSCNLPTSVLPAVSR